ncbi:MAG: hypothetical protein U0X76_11040 [Bacteroidia bacterium]
MQPQSNYYRRCEPLHFCFRWFFYNSASITLGNSGNATRDSYVSITSGSVTVTGNITMPEQIHTNFILFPGGSTGTLYIGEEIAFAGGGGSITSTAGSGLLLLLREQ